MMIIEGVYPIYQMMEINWSNVTTKSINQI